MMINQKALEAAICRFDLMTLDASHTVATKIEHAIKVYEKVKALSTENEGLSDHTTKETSDAN